MAQGRFELWKQSKPVVQRLVSIDETTPEGFFVFYIGQQKIENKPKATEICWM